MAAGLERVERGEAEDRHRPEEVGREPRGRILEEVESIGQQKEGGPSDEGPGAGGEDHRLVSAEIESAEATQESDHKSREGRDQCRSQTRSTIPCRAILDQVKARKPWCSLRGNKWSHRGQADGDHPLPEPGSESLEYFERQSRILAGILDYLLKRSRFIEVDPDVPCGRDGPLAQLRQPKNYADSSHGNPLAEKGLVYYTRCVESTEIVLRPRGGREKPEKPA